MANVCAFFSTPEGSPYKNIASITCNNTALAKGQHGWLCLPHRRFLEQSMERHRSFLASRVPPIDADEALVQGIILSERKAIEGGKVARVRYGALEPEYIHYWEQ